MSSEKHSSKERIESNGESDSPFINKLVFDDEEFGKIQEFGVPLPQLESPFLFALEGKEKELIEPETEEIYELVDEFEDEEIDDFIDEEDEEEFVDELDEEYNIEEEDFYGQEDRYKWDIDEIDDEGTSRYEEAYSAFYREDTVLEEAFVFNLKNLLDLWRQKKSASNPATPLPQRSPSGRKLKLPIVSTPMPHSPHYTVYSSRKRYYGVPETIAALKWIGKEWNKLHPTVRMHIGDISQIGGGKIPPHKSHRMGIDADVHLRINGKRIVVGYEKPIPGDPDAKPRIIEYKIYQSQRRYVRDFVNIVKRNPYLPIRQIGFRDLTLKKETNNLVQDWERHIRHLHLRFCLPANRAQQLDIDKVYSSNERKPPYACKEKAKSSI
ncbi:MAG: penicillin-insensitive murein endopeptidase, partial [Candidatus Hodarchaeota archaeon]